MSRALIDTLITWAMALAILGLYAVVQQADAQDHRAEWQASEALHADQKLAQSALRRDMAAAALCREQHGESSFVWTEAGMLVCIPRHSIKVAL
jgi:Tfp pilus assembly protein PilV